MADNKAPIIIKKIKKGGHGHHGGAWKVAYADFVTAMMAFFLLLWLLAATPAENLKGLADYFSPTMGLKDRMGIGFRGGQGTSAEGVSADDWASQGLVFGAPPSGPASKLTEQTYSSGDGGDSPDAERFSVIQADLKKAIVENPALDEVRDSVLVELTSEGLKIEVTDLDNRPMFFPGTADLQPYAKEMLAEIARTIRFIPNYITISGHTNSIRYLGSRKDYGNWELSADRANASRRFLVESGIDKEQITKVIAKADRDPINYDQPLSAENRRITLVLLKQSIAAENKKVAPEKLLDSVNQGQEDYIPVKAEGAEAQQENVIQKNIADEEDVVNKNSPNVRKIPALDPVRSKLEDTNQQELKKIEAEKGEGGAGVDPSNITDDLF